MQCTYLSVYDPFAHVQVGAGGAVVAQLLLRLDDSEQHVGLVIPMVLLLLFVVLTLCVVRHHNGGRRRRRQRQPQATAVRVVRPAVVGGRHRHGRGHRCDDRRRWRMHLDVLLLRPPGHPGPAVSHGDGHGAQRPHGHHGGHEHHCGGGVCCCCCCCAGGGVRDDGSASAATVPATLVSAVTFHRARRRTQQAIVIRGDDDEPHLQTLCWRWDGTRRTNDFWFSLLRATCTAETRYKNFIYESVFLLLLLLHYCLIDKILLALRYPGGTAVRPYQRSSARRVETVRASHAFIAVILIWITIICELDEKKTSLVSVNYYYSVLCAVSTRRQTRPHNRNWTAHRPRDVVDMQTRLAPSSDYHKRLNVRATRAPRATAATHHYNARQPYSNLCRGHRTVMVQSHPSRPQFRDIVIICYDYYPILLRRCFFFFFLIIIVVFSAFIGTVDVLTALGRGHFREK